MASSFASTPRSEGGDVEFLPLLRELADVDLLAAQRGLQFGLVGRCAFARTRSRPRDWFRDM